MRGAPGSPAGEDPRGRILSPETLFRRHGRPRRERIVFTNGCFDLLHRGHASLLLRARALGDRLVVGLNSDRSVARLKGPGRPLQPAEDRAYVLASLRWVDVVTVFEEDTPLALLEGLLPDHLVKGADWSRAELPGAELVEAAGGRVHLLPLEEGRGTRDLIRRAARLTRPPPEP